MATPDPIAVAPLEVQPAIGRDQSECSGRILLLGGGREAQRFDERVAEAHVHEPRFVQMDSKGEVIEWWPKRCPIVVDTCLEEVDREAQIREQRREGAIQFVAEAAPAGDPDLPDERRRVHRHRLTEQHARVFERDGAQVGDLERAQCLDVGREGPVYSQSVSIRGKIAGIDRGRHVRGIAISMRPPVTRTG